MSFHHGKLDRNERLQKLYKFLKSRGQVTSMQISRRLPSVAPATDISALRHCLKAKPRDGYINVMCERIKGVPWYWLVRA